MKILSKIKNSQYTKIKNKYPNAEYVYNVYKNHNQEFHNQNKIKSWTFLRQLISASKKNIDLKTIPFPTGTHNPFLSRTCTSTKQNKEKSDCLAIPDSKLLPRKSPKELANELMQYEIISFDIFDTLIFRPFAKPTDVFYLIEAETGVLDFCNLRKVAEAHSRQVTTKPNFEVDIYDIYRDLSTRCFLTEKDAEKEIEIEKQVCYANEYMLDVIKILKSKKKTIITTSDMYLPSNIIKSILDKNGFTDFDNIFVSCEHGYNKASGKLFDIVKKHYPNAKRIAHVGDNLEADVKGAEKAGITPFYYQQCNAFGNQYRPSSLISPVGSMYKGIVNNYMYSGTHSNTAREDFAFVYAGPLVSGYLEWINTFCKTNDCDFIMFLARDMDIFYKVYNKHYKEYDNGYGAASRFALQELIAGDFPDEFFFHTVKSRCNRGYTLKQTLREINLEILIDKCKEYKLNENDFIVPDKISKIEKLFKDNIQLISSTFKKNEEAAKIYFKSLIGDHKRLCLVDLGWRGSVLAYLKYLLVDKWQLCEDVKGVLIGSTTSDTSVNWISQGIVSSYIYNHVKNRDYHRNADNWNREYIGVLIMESIFTSADASLLEYRLSDNKCGYELFKCSKNPNENIINQFHTGVMRFADEFEKARKPFKKHLPMTEVDAYEPIFQISDKYEYIARIVGDIVDTPYAIAGINIKEQKYVPIGELILEQGLIQHWPIK